MSATNKNKKSRLPVFWLIFTGSITVLALLIIFQPEREAIDPTHLPWNAQYDQAGKLHALGLTVQQSTLRDAMALYGKDVEIKMFSDIDEANKSIEAFFPIIYIGSIKAAIALKLEVKPEVLASSFEDGKNITMSPTGGRQIELYSSELEKFLDATFSSITLLPKKHLPERAIKMRFGEPDKEETQSDNLPHLFFYDLGLEMIVDEEGPEALQYTNTLKAP